MMGRQAGLRLAIGNLARRALFSIAFGAVAVAGFAAAPVRADDYGRLSLIEDNDGLLPDHRDRHYTQGATIAYLSPSLKPDDYSWLLADSLTRYSPFFQPGPGVQRKFDLVVGQTIFTPNRYHDLPPDPRDRPFAGFLFTGGGVMQDTNGTMLENLELLGGTIGPHSLAKEAQITFHRWAGFNNANLNQTYKYQLRNEPGFMLTYERKWRIWQTSLLGVQAEVIPEAGITAGNVMTYGAVGATVRIGQNLNVDYGIPRVRPAVGASTWFDASKLTQDFGWYLFAGAQGRAVVHNIFLDGNSFAISRSVDRNILVADFSAGVSVFWRDWVKFDFHLTERSKEFRTQGTWDHFGSGNLSVLF